MILFVEMQCKDWEHNRVNVGIIKLIKNTFPNEQTKLCAEKNHIAQIENLLAADGMGIDAEEIDFADWRQGNENSRDKYAGLLASIVRNHQDVTDVMLLSCNRGIVLACADVSKMWSGVKFHIFLHAALEEVCHDHRRTLKSSIRELLSCIRHLRLPSKHSITMRESMERCVSCNCNFFVYSPNYAKGLEGKIKDSVIDKITFLHHPFYESNLKHSNGQSDSVIIGIYGQAVKQNALEIVKAYNEKYDNGTVTFQVMAKKENEIFQQRNVVRLFEKDYISNEELEEAISRFDYILLPYSQNEYVVTASGIFCDAVSQEVPLLMLDSPYLTFYYKYHVGVLEDSIDKLAKRISELNVNTEEYLAGEKELKQLSFEENMSIIRESLSLH